MFGLKKKISFVLLPLSCALLLQGCADATVPQPRNVEIPPPLSAKQRQDAINERPDSVMYLPLGKDVLLPSRIAGDKMPTDRVGPFELRSETLAGALQLILADYDISIAFESEQGLTRRVTVANLKGPLDKVVQRVCSLADLYCSYEDETIVVKDTQTFAVTLPPLADMKGGQEFIDDVIQGLTAVIGGSGIAPVSDPTTRTVIYSATQRTAKLADDYFQRLRANTAMIVFETYIWEVSLNAGNSTGIDWDKIQSFGKFNTSIGINGSVGADFTNPISIGLPTTQAVGASPSDLIQFLSQFGAVKTISQPQITVLSGASAELRVADTENYVSEVSQTINGDNTTTSVDTDSVDSGFTLTIGSSWDKSTVYANVNVNLTNVDQIEDFTFSDSGATGTDTIIQLPQTSERELTTQIRVRPGDSVLIAGLVRENDNYDTRGPGFMKPIIPDSRTVQTDNLELVILLRPRVIVYTNPEDGELVKPEVTSIPVSQPVAVPAVELPKPVVTPAQTVQQITPTPNPTPIIVQTTPIESVEIISPAPDAVSSAPVPVFVDTVPVTPVIAPQPPSAIQPRPTFETQDQGVYIPRNSGYTPRYVSRNSDIREQNTAAQPMVSAPINVPTQPFFEQSISSSGINSVLTSNFEPVSPPTPTPSQPMNTSPLPQDIYNQATSINVYDAYERSVSSQ